VHLGVDLDGLTRYAGDLATKTMPERPFLLFGQMTTADESRSPAGTESAWTYSHLPRGVDFSPDVIARHVSVIEAVIERHAPGFGELVDASVVQSPSSLQKDDPALIQGAINGGTAQLHQQLVFRPVPGLGGAITPVDRLYLGGCSAHPGGGVHGSPGYNAARSALARNGRLGRPKRRLYDALAGRIYGAGTVPV
jgi:phytoene dehydrogenase-like protein